MSSKWTTANIPDQSGKVAIGTGANSGIGYETAKALAAKGATVIMACRNLEKAHAAADKIKRDVPGAKLDIIQLDLADLAAVREFAAQFQARYDQLNLLINNAGIMFPPFTETKDGFEVQFGANHLGHFALTGLLLDTLLVTSGARVVNVSSMAHRMGKIDFDNLNAEKGYNPSAAYAQSKLANLLFSLELNRQFEAHGLDLMAVSAHPGWTATNLQRGLMATATRIVGQSAPMGALPTLRAATDPNVRPNEYYDLPASWKYAVIPRRSALSPQLKTSHWRKSCGTCRKR